MSEDALFLLPSFSLLFFPPSFFFPILIMSVSTPFSGLSVEDVKGCLGYNLDVIPTDAADPKIKVKGGECKSEKIKNGKYLLITFHSKMQNKPFKFNFFILFHTQPSLPEI